MTDTINHSFNIEFASRYGIEESIIFGNIYHWCIHNKNNDNNLKKGKDGVERYYTFNSVSALQQEYRYISITKVYRVIEKLENEGLIITGCFNKRVGDRTRWYAITEKGEQIFIECNQTLTSTLYNNAQFSNCKLQNEMHILQNDRHNLQNEMTLPIINKTINTNVNSSEVDTSDKPKNEPPRFINSNNEVKKSSRSKKPSKTELNEQFISSLSEEDFKLSEKCAELMIEYLKPITTTHDPSVNKVSWQADIAKRARAKKVSLKTVLMCIQYVHDDVTGFEQPICASPEKIFRKLDYLYGKALSKAKFKRQSNKNVDGVNMQCKAAEEYDSALF